MCEATKHEQSEKPANLVRVKASSCVKYDRRVKEERGCTDQSVDDLMFDGGEHPFKLLRLRGDHSRTQVGVASYRSERHTH